MPVQPPRVLIIESRAHLSDGHPPIMFAELAAAMIEEGRDVAVFTSRGWSTSPGESSTFPVHHLHPALLAIYVAFGTLHRFPFRSGRWLATAVRDSIMALSARRLAKQLEAAEIVMVSMATDPWIWSLLIGRGRVLLYQFDPPQGEPWAIIKRRAAAIERRRRALGNSRIRIVVNSDLALDAWRTRTPWLTPTKIAFTGSRPPEAATHSSREQLGLGSANKIALQFGYPHLLKDPETVWKAFSQLADWTLVIAGGGAADAYREWRDRHSPIGTSPVLFDGFATDEMRQGLHAVANLAVLSFRSGISTDSGTINDAIRHGIPVIASRPGFAADVVERLELGPTFVAGDPESLIEAVRQAPTSLSAEVITRAQADTSITQVARDHLSRLSADDDAVPFDGA